DCSPATAVEHLRLGFAACFRHPPSPQYWGLCVGGETLDTMTIAALILPFALLQAVDPSADTSTRFQQCVALIDSHPDRAYEEGMAWAAETHSLSGFRCAAMA